MSDDTMMRFDLDAAQLSKLRSWCTEQDKIALVEQQQKGTADPFIKALHESGQPYFGAIGGEVTFSFTPTSIGVVVCAKHSGTGNEIDLTNYDEW